MLIKFCKHDPSTVIVVLRSKGMEFRKEATRSRVAIELSLLSKYPVVNCYENLYSAICSLDIQIFFQDKI